MADKDFTLTADRLRELLNYDPETGIFIWKPRPLEYFLDKRSFARWNTRYVGTVAGTSHPNGYWQISVFNKRFLAHRLAWLFVYGDWPEKLTDHINGDKLDNRICNLRAANYSQNCWNKRNNGRGASKFKGVVRSSCGARWVAQIGFNRKTIHLGTYASEQEAANAIRSARKALHKEYACHD